uniref:Uncharacterized protein n=1 Tax=Caenorhabditis japonica TaxID=281687 RepID=A0A8R1EQM1_CAEJA
MAAILAISFEDPSSRIPQRIWLSISQFDIEIKHIDGKRNTAADFLSRAKDEVTPLPEEEFKDIVEFPVCMAVKNSKDRVSSRFTLAGTQRPYSLTFTA